MGKDPVQALIDATPKRSCDLGNSETLTYRTFNAHNANNPDAIKLLFIPGYAGDATTLLAPELALAFSDHYVVAVNPRGYAGSTFNVPVDNHEDYADDIKLFMDKVGLTKDVVVMGWSTGGGAAAWLAIKHPEIVRAAILKNSIALHGYRFPGVDTFAKMKDVIDTVFADGLHNPDESKFYEGLAMLMPGLPSMDDPKMKRFHQAAVAHVNREHAQWANVTFNVTPIQTSTTPPSTALRELKVPLIVLHGATDFVCHVNQVRAVTQLAMAEQWAPEGLLSYYEHEGGHAPIMIPAEADSFLRVYRKAIEERVLNKKENESGDAGGKVEEGATKEAAEVASPEQ